MTEITIQADLNSLDPQSIMGYRVKLREQMIYLLIVLQKRFDQAVFKEYNLDYEDIIKAGGYFNAILDEFGEWNHTRKSEWCWWKKSQKPSNRQEEIEEFADLLHFCISHDLAAYDGDVDVAFRQVINAENSTVFFEEDYFWDVENILEKSKYKNIVITPKLLQIGEKMGYSFEVIYAAYIEKNRKNFERLENNY